MNVKDLPQGSYKVVNSQAPGTGKLVNVKDLPQGAYKIIGGQDKPDSFRFNQTQPEQHQSVESLQTAQRQAEQESKKASSFGGMVKNFGQGLVETVGSSEVGLGNSIQKIFGNPQEAYTRIEGQDSENQNKIIKAIRENKAQGKDTSALEKIYNRNADAMGKARLSADQETALPTTGQVLGQVGGTALDLLSAGSYGTEAKGAESFKLAKAKPSLLQGIEDFAKKPSGLFTKEGATKVGKSGAIGYGYDVTQGLQGNRGENRTDGKAFIPGAGTAIGLALPTLTEGTQSVKNSYNKVSKDVDTLAGTITQGDKADIPAAKRALSNIDTSQVRTYQDLTNILDSKIENVSTKLDEVLSARPDIRKLDDLGVDINVGDQNIKHNYVSDALNQLEEFYTKTNRPRDAAEMSGLRSKAETQGLKIIDLENLAKLHGKELNAFNANGELASGLTKQAAENTRAGIKGTARGIFGDKVYKAVDEQRASLIRTRDLIKEVGENVNKLKQKVTQRGVGERVGRLIFQVADKFTGGGLRGFIQSFIPRGEGLKIMNALDLEKGLQKNLSQLQKLTSSDVSETELIRTLEQILNKPPSPIKGYLPPAPIVTPIPKDKTGSFYNPQNDITRLNNIKMLPEPKGSIIYGTQTDKSGISLKSATKQLFRDPKTGQIRKGYKSE